MIAVSRGSATISISVITFFVRRPQNLKGLRYHVFLVYARHSKVFNCEVVKTDPSKNYLKGFNRSVYLIKFYQLRADFDVSKSICHKQQILLQKMRGKDALLQWHVLCLHLKSRNCNAGLPPLMG